MTNVLLSHYFYLYSFVACVIAAIVRVCLLSRRKIKENHINIPLSLFAHLVLFYSVVIVLGWALGYWWVLFIALLVIYFIPTKKPKAKVYENSDGYNPHDIDTYGV